MNDEIINIGQSVVQHGKHNDRIYLMKLSAIDFPHIIAELHKIAAENKYSKIFAKVPEYAKDEFIKNGYIQEGSIPSFYNNTENVYFMSRFFSKKRSINDKESDTINILETAKSKSAGTARIDLNPSFTYRVADESLINQMSALYSEVFETYPFPINEPEYIRKTMNTNVIYFCIMDKDRIIALSSSEMDVKSGNVEMTDFAVLPEYRGENLAVFLLQKMEDEMRKHNINVSYTIARALSFGMNITFAKTGYIYGGTLINNTNISGSLESMNIWYKPL